MKRWLYGIMTGTLLLFVNAGWTQQIVVEDALFLESATQAIRLVDSARCLVTTHDGVLMVDRSDPEALVRRGHVNVWGEGPVLAWAGNHAYALNAQNYSMCTMDFSDDQNPVVVDTITMQEVLRISQISNLAAGMNCLTALAPYVLLVLDLSDPAHPQLVDGDSAGHAYCTQATRGHFCYLAGERGFDIADVSVPSAYTITGSIALNRCGRCVGLDGDRAYVGTGQGVIILDISDPVAPAIIDSTSRGYTANAVAVSGTTLYVADGGGLLKIFDISDPSDPVWMMDFDTPGFAYDLAIEDSLLYVADNDALVVLRYIPPVSATPESELLPLSLELEAAYPNPFNASTTLIFSLVRSESVKLSVYDLLGRERAMLFQGMQSAGRHELRWDADGLPSGLYFARLESGNRTLQQKLMLLK